MATKNSITPTINDLEGMGGAPGATVFTSSLQEQMASVRDAKVNWQSYVQGMMISKEDFSVAKSLDFATSSSPDESVSYFHDNSSLCVKIIFHMLRKIAKEQTLQYILTMVDDLLQHDRSLVDVIKKEASKEGESVWGPFMNLLTRSDPFIVQQSSRIITKIACWSKDRMDSNSLDHYLHFIRTQLVSPNNAHLTSVLRCLQMMLRIDDYKQAFVSADGLATLSNVIANKLNFQIQYQIIHCFWTLSFSPEICVKIIDYNVVPSFVEVLSEAVKEKVVRIILATFRNFLEKPEDSEVVTQFALSMVVHDLIKHLKFLEAKKYTDEDLVEDMEFLREKLVESVADFSSMDEYSTEVKSGHLEWSPVHRDERFWRENADRLNERNYELLKMLIHILETTRDPLILCVATHDIGQYVRHYPRGKKVIEQLDGKTIVMQLLKHEDQNVRYYALLAVQKLMVQNWEYLGRQVDAEISEAENKKSGDKPAAAENKRPK